MYKYVRRGGEQINGGEKDPGARGDATEKMRRGRVKPTVQNAGMEERDSPSSDNPSSVEQRTSLAPHPRSSSCVVVRHLTRLSLTSSRIKTSGSLTSAAASATLFLSPPLSELNGDPSR